MDDEATNRDAGKVTFDEYGDTTSRNLTVYQVKSSARAPVNTEEFK